MISSICVLAHEIRTVHPPIRTKAKLSRFFLSYTFLALRLFCMCISITVWLSLKSQVQISFHNSCKLFFTWPWGSFTPWFKLWYWVCILTSPCTTRFVSGPTGHKKLLYLFGLTDQFADLVPVTGTLEAPGSLSCFLFVFKLNIYI